MNFEAISLLLSVNYTQRVEILSKWLYIKDVARLDSALCCKSVRQIFLKQLAQNHIVLSAKEHMCTYNALDWLILKSARVDTLVIFKFDGKMQSYVSQFGQFVKRVQLYIRRESNERDFAAITIAQHCLQLSSLYTGQTFNQLILLFGCCRYLQHLSCGNLTGSEILAVSKCCLQLQTLVLDMANSEEWENQLRCLTNCRDLRTLCITNADLSGHTEDIILIANNCLHLRIVSLGRIDCSALAAMVHSCPHMVCFRATLTDAFTAELLRNIAQYWHNIEVLRLQNQQPLPVGTVWDDACVELVQQCLSLVELAVYTSSSIYRYYEMQSINIVDNNRVHTSTEQSTSALQELVGSSLSGAALGGILQVSKQLQKVVFIGDSCSAAALQSLGTASAVVNLNFSVQNLASEDLEPLHGLKNLRIDDIPPGWGEQLVATIERCQALTSLSLTFSHAVDTSFLPRLLQQCSKLTFLLLVAQVGEESMLCERGSDLLEAVVRLLCPDALDMMIVV